MSAAEAYTALLGRPNYKKGDPPSRSALLDRFARPRNSAPVDNRWRDESF